jgi:hypothetical protein
MNQICNVIKDRMQDLFKNSVFVPSSSITGLDDSTIIVRLGGDKEGKTMAFEFGLTVMNCLQPILPENFDLIATVMCIIISRPLYLTNIGQSCIGSAK